MLNRGNRSCSQTSCSTRGQTRDPIREVPELPGKVFSVPANHCIVYSAPPTARATLGTDGRAPVGSHSKSSTRSRRGIISSHPSGTSKMDRRLPFVLSSSEHRGTALPPSGVAARDLLVPLLQEFHRVTRHRAARRHARAPHQRPQNRKPRRAWSPLNDDSQSIR